MSFETATPTDFSTPPSATIANGWLTCGSQRVRLRDVQIYESCGTYLSVRLVGNPHPVSLYPPCVDWKGPYEALTKRLVDQLDNHFLSKP